jgi:hypothetical protein
MSLRNLFLSTIQQGLQRKSIQKPSAWAEKYRIMGTPYPGPWTWDHHPWLKDMHDSNASENIGQKAAQMGFSELALNLVLYNLDIPKYDCLYVLPNTRPDAQDFSISRFNKAIDLSEHIENMFTETNNVGLKKAGTAILYVRGSNSRKQMKSIPTGIIIFDELDEMLKKNITLAEERSAGQVFKMNWKISTPTIPGNGINEYFMNSTQEEYFFKCPSCSKRIQFKFPESLVITGESIHDPNLVNSYYICYECKAVLPQEAKPYYLKNGIWVPKVQTHNSRGFHVSQLYSSTISPTELATKFLKAQQSQVEEQEFYNSKLGLPHVARGARVMPSDVDQCIKSHKMIEGHDKSGRLITMGVDVGRVCHYEISEWFLSGTDVTGPDLNMFAFPEVLRAGTCDFPELVKLMNHFRINSAVIDYLPETRKSIEFASKFPGFVWCCLYNHHVKAKNISATDKTYTVSVNRTAWLDLSLGRFMSQQIRLPQDIPHDYKTQVQAPVKVSRYDQYGEVVSRFETPGQMADHYAHARNYCEIALPFAMGYGPTINSEKVM